MYTVIKLLHVIAVIVLVGNLISAIHWKRGADHGSGPDLVAHTFGGLVRAERRFTMPSVAVVILTGFALMYLAHLPLSTPWVAGGLLSMLGAAGSSMLGMRPAARRIRALCSEPTWDGARFRLLSDAWERWAWLALLLLFIAVALMVIKPEV